MVSIDDFKKEIKKRQVTEKLDKAVKYVEEHKEVFLIGVPVAIGICKFGAKQISISRLQKLRDLTIYDQSAGHRWELLRKPSQNEWGIIEARKRAGETYYEILTSMKLLRR